MIWVLRLKFSSFHLILFLHKGIYLSLSNKLLFPDKSNKAWASRYVLVYYDHNIHLKVKLLYFISNVPFKYKFICFNGFTIPTFKILLLRKNITIIEYSIYKKPINKMNLQIIEINFLLFSVLFLKETMSILQFVTKETALNIPTLKCSNYF